MIEARRDLFFIAAFCGVLFLTSLGSRDLWNPNEPIYAQAVVEMERRGDWLVPWVNERVFAEKPILYYWLALPFTWLGGIDERTLRLPSVAAGFLCVLGVWLLVRPYAGRTVARVASVLMATEFLVFWSARSIQMDIFVCAATLGVMIPVTRVWDHGANPWKGWTLAGVAAGLGFLAKGPVAWICPGLALAVYALVSRRLRELTRAPVWAGVASCLVVAAPWYLLLWATGRDEALWEVLVRQNFVRFVEAWDHQRPWWYYFKYFWIDYAPWAPLVLVALRLPDRSAGERRLATLSWSLLLAVVVFFSLSDSKRSPYTLPIATSVAVLGGEVVAKYLDQRLGRVRGLLLEAGAGLWGMVLALGGLALIWLARMRFPEAAAAATASGGVMLVAGTVVVLVLVRMRRPRAVALAVLGSVAATYLAVAAWALPAANEWKSARALGESLASRAHPEDRMLAYGIWQWRANYTYYAGRPIPPVGSLDAVREAWSGEQSVWILVEGDRVNELREVIGEVPPVLTDRVGRTEVYVFSSRQDGQ